MALVKFHCEGPRKAKVKRLLKISLLSLYFFLGLYQGVTLNRGNLEGTLSKEYTTTSDLES